VSPTILIFLHHVVHNRQHDGGALKKRVGRKRRQTVAYAERGRVGGSLAGFIRSAVWRAVPDCVGFRIAAALVPKDC